MLRADEGHTGAFVRVRVLDLDGAEAFEPDAASICISINERAISAAEIPEDSYRAVLRLVFDDIDREVGAGWVLFGEDHARRIMDFVREHHDATELVIHCTFGQSRSPGVALGIADLLGLDADGLERRYPDYNRHVRAVMNRVREETHGS